MTDPGDQGGEMVEGSGISENQPKGDGGIRDQGSSHASYPRDPGIRDIAAVNVCASKGS